MNPLDTFFELEMSELPSVLQKLVTEDGADPFEVMDAYDETPTSGFAVGDIVAAWQEFKHTGTLAAALEEYMWNAG